MSAATNRQVSLAWRCSPSSTTCHATSSRRWSGTPPRTSATSTAPRSAQASSTLGTALSFAVLSLVVVVVGPVHGLQGSVFVKSLFDAAGHILMCMDDSKQCAFVFV